MAKITLSNVENLQSWTNAGSTLDANSAILETAFDKTLSRDGTSPNQMMFSLDMNSNQIINLPAPSTNTSPVRLIDVVEGVPTTIVNGVTSITGGNNGQFLFDNNGVVGFAVPAGGGSGNTLTPFATITALANLAAPVSPVLAVVSDAVRGGTFLWVSSNQSTNVTNDPGKGIYVAPASAPTGASGAWVRQYDGVQVDAGWWGYTPDATTTVDPWGLLTFSTTATGSSGQPVLTVASTTGILPGMRASGTGLSLFAGTVTSNNIVLSVNVGASQITLNRNLIGNISGGTITFQGPVVGTGTDNSVPFINIGKWARTQTNAVNIRFAPGTALWNGPTTSGTDVDNNKNIAYAWTYKIPNLTIDAYGAIWQNTYNQAISGADSGGGATFPLNIRTEVQGYLINQTVVNTNSFTLVNAADVAASGIVPGNVVYLACNDQQFLGYPGNPGQFEVVTVSSIVGTTINTVENIKYIHATDYPDLNFTPSINTNSGYARMWVQPDQTWQGTNVIKGLQVNLAPGMPQGLYATLSKNKLHTIDWVGAGFSETVATDITHDNPTLYSPGELDKYVDQVTYNNLRGPIGLGLQSSNPNRLYINGGNFGGLVGCGKQTYVRGAKMAIFQAAATYGMSTSTILDNCDITTSVGTSTGNVIDATQLSVIDGTNVTFANGIITIDPIAVAGSINDWGVTRGMWCNLQANTPNGNIFSNDLGTGLILKNTWDPFATAFTTKTATGGATGSTQITVSDATSLTPNMGISGTGIAAGTVIWQVVGLILVLSRPNTGTVSGTMTITKPTMTITTTLTQFPTIPSWATGSIYFFKVNEVIARKCIGDDAIRQMSDANDAGQRYFEYRRIPFGGPSGASMFVDAPTGCALTEVDVNVITPHNVANSNLTITQSTIQSPAMISDSTGGTVITTRLDIAGLRRITQTAFDGYPTGSGTLDHIAVGGVAVDTLPTGRVVGPTTSLAFPATNTAVGEIILKYSAGMARKPLTRKYDDSTFVTSAHTILATSNAGLP